ncbi:uncharacterized protein LOC142326883 [Lycorma delicatula]|uniref:uncharacterized protein LOC142326883 n=1 Tax=Lycorma delicatula TaxID=130591 RepID=UPI003F512711
MSGFNLICLSLLMVAYLAPSEGMYSSNAGQQDPNQRNRGYVSPPYRYPEPRSFDFQGNNYMSPQQPIPSQPNPPSYFGIPNVQQIERNVPSLEQIQQILKMYYSNSLPKYQNSLNFPNQPLSAAAEAQGQLTSNVNPSSLLNGVSDTVQRGLPGQSTLTGSNDSPPTSGPAMNQLLKENKNY